MGTGRRFGAVLTVLAVAVSLSFATAIPAGAATADVETSREAWFLVSGQRTNVPGTGIQAQTPNPNAPNHFPVNLTRGEPEKRVYLEWDIAALNAGSFSRFDVTLRVSRPDDSDHVQEHLSEEQRPVGTFNDDGAAIVACPLKPGEFIPDAQGEPSTVTTTNQDGEPTQVEQEPEFDCGVAEVPLERSENGEEWTADLAPIADTWTEQMSPTAGVVLRPVDPEGPLDTFEVEFHGSALDGISTKAEFTPAAPAPLSGAFSAPSDLQARGGGGADVFTETIPPQPGEPPQSETVQRAVGREGVPESGAGHLPWYVWLLVPVGALGFYVTSRALRPRWAQGLTSADNRIASTLRARRLGLAT